MTLALAAIQSAGKAALSGTVPWVGMSGSVIAQETGAVRRSAGHGNLAVDIPPADVAVPFTKTIRVHWRPL